MRNCLYGHNFIIKWLTLNDHVPSELDLLVGPYAIEKNNPYVSNLMDYSNLSLYGVI